MTVVYARADAREFQHSKSAVILLLLALLIAADMALGAYTWNFASAQAEQQELALMMRNRDLLKKDIQRAREIRGQHSRNSERLRRI